MVKGPRPKGEYVGKSSVFSTRIRPDLRKRLEVAAKTSGRSLSQEVEHRLRRSFVEDDKIVDAFGDRRTYRLMRLMTDAIHLSQKGGHQNDEGWLDDPFRFRIALAAMRNVVEAIEPYAPSPHGEVEDADVEIATDHLGAAVAGKIWSDVTQANQSIELGAGSFADHINSIARADIGEDVLGRALPAIRAHFFKTYRSQAAQDALQDFQEEELKLKEGNDE
jgi:hypothetical protein